MKTYVALALALLVSSAASGFAQDERAPTPDELEGRVAPEPLEAYERSFLSVVDGALLVTTVNSSGQTLNSQIYGVWAVAEGGSFIGALDFAERVGDDAMVDVLEAELARSRSRARGAGIAGAVVLAASIPFVVDGLLPQRIDSDNPLTNWPGRKDLEPLPLVIGGVLVGTSGVLLTRAAFGTSRRERTQRRVGNYYTREQALELGNAANLAAARRLEIGARPRPPATRPDDNDDNNEDDGQDLDLDVRLDLSPRFASITFTF